MTQKEYELTAKLLVMKLEKLETEERQKYQKAIPGTTEWYRAEERLAIVSTLRTDLVYDFELEGSK